MVSEPLGSGTVVPIKGVEYSVVYPKATTSLLQECAGWWKQGREIGEKVGTRAPRWTWAQLKTHQRCLGTSNETRA